MNTKIEMKSHHDFVTNFIDTRKMAAPEEPKQPVFEGEIGTTTEAEEYAY